MLAIVQFVDGRYGLQNQWTGIVLPKSFRTSIGAALHARRLNRRLAKSVRRINKKMNNHTSK